MNFHTAGHTFQLGAIEKDETWVWEARVGALHFFFETVEAPPVQNFVDSLLTAHAEERRLVEHTQKIRDELDHHII